MNDVKWRRAQEIFKAAVEQPSAERAALLADACGADAELRREVESLLEHDERMTNNFLRPPEALTDRRAPHGGPTGEDDGADPLLGRRVGEFTIRRVIAAGGMGKVYEAEQDRPRRLVALKMMRRYVASRSALRRFQFESEILGKLRHPNIAQVYAAGMYGGEVREGIHGTAGDSAIAPGVPYFAMEYIPDARTITDFADSSGLDARERLRLFAKVCDAVHHGHQKGVIHRDLKPGNILVGADGEPKVIDFGVARATDSDVALTTMHTDAGALIGTLQYMSPEQCDADPREIDTRSDVYALGVVLYELLTGEWPYDATGTTIVHAARIIREIVPQPLSRLNRRLRGDVETIVLKALEKTREKRYQSAAEMGQDIRRHLDGSPIEARPPTTWQRLARRIARHPVATATAASLFIAAVINATALIASWVLNARPYEIEIVNQGHETRLWSLGGTPLHDWDSKRHGKVNCAELAERPAALGGGQLALLGVDCNPETKLRGTLSAFELDGDLDRPIWSRRVETAEILPVLVRERGYTDAEFGVLYCWFHDVFEETPGDEIIAIFAAGIHSQRVIRIYDLAGDLLYEAWHEGALNDHYWLADAGLLVFTGDNQMENWREDKLQNEKCDPYVVFALRPRRDAGKPDSFIPMRPDDGSQCPAWYLPLEPPNAKQLVEGPILLQQPDAPLDAGKYLKCFLTVNKRISAHVWWVLDENGREDPRGRGASAEYQRNQMLPDDDPCKLPSPYSFRLVPVAANATAPPSAEDAAGTRPFTP